MYAKSPKSYPTLCNPKDYRSPGSSVHGILQERILQWVSMPSSRRSSWPRDQTSVSYVSCTGGLFTTSATWEVLMYCLKFTWHFGSHVFVGMTATKLNISRSFNLTNRSGASKRAKPRVTEWGDPYGDYSSWSQSWKWKWLSQVQLFEIPWTIPWDSPGQNTGVGSQGIFPTQGSNPGLLIAGKFFTK